MKMDRLIGILSILLQREKVTAPELAEQFEVSRRTIQRDIESPPQLGWESNGMQAVEKVSHKLGFFVHKR